MRTNYQLVILQINPSATDDARQILAHGIVLSVGAIRFEDRVGQGEVVVSCPDVKIVR